MHPLDAIQTWFDSLAPDAKSWAATRLASSLPTEAPNVLFDALDEGERIVREWLAHRNHYTEQLGRALAARAIVSFELIRQAESTDYWQEQKEMNEAMLSHFEEKGSEGLAERSRRNLDRLPLAEAEWREASRLWRELCDTQLSDAAIVEWQSEAQRAARERLNEEIKKPRTITATGTAMRNATGGSVFK